ncbi:MAG: hypothetical protein IKJ75_05575 [Clostridia bacterium]|nr:hypothetical protein [Clostridia bacterium]
MNTGKILPAVMLGMVCGGVAGAAAACAVKSMCAGSTCKAGALLIKAGKKMNDMKSMF